MGRERTTGIRLGRSSGRVNSSSSIMEKRGDAWLTPREQVQDFNRLLDIENADRDADNQRHTAEYWERRRLRERQERPIVANPKQVSTSYMRQMANVRQKHRILRQRDTLEYKASAPVPKILRFCDGCRLSACRVTNRCQKRENER
jgi:hypothetical protein